MVATYGSNYFIFWGISAFHTFLICCGSPVEIFIYFYFVFNLQGNLIRNKVKRPQPPQQL